MNKIAIPALLVATVMVAGAFAFMPVEQASTVHLSATTTLAAADIATLTGNVEHLTVTLVPGGAIVGDTPLFTLANGEDTETIHVLVLSNTGTPVLTLIAGDFVGLATLIDGSAAATLVFAAEIGSGLYTMTLDSGDFGGIGFVEYNLLVTVDDVNNDDTTEAGAGQMYIALEVLG